MVNGTFPAKSFATNHFQQNLVMWYSWNTPSVDSLIQFTVNTDRVATLYTNMFASQVHHLFALHYDKVGQIPSHHEITIIKHCQMHQKGCRDLPFSGIDL